MQKYIKGYKRWLATMGYSESTVINNPTAIGWLMDHLEKSGVENLREVKKEDIESYIKELRTRKHKRRSGTLSNSYINKQFGTIRNFDKYLGRVHGIRLPLEMDHTSASLSTRLEEHPQRIEILSKKEILKLYATCDSSALGLRDKAMLAIYYGCGLRRSEGTQLDLSDIDMKEKLILVRKAKNHKQRLVPITEGIKNELQNYLDHGRPLLLKKKACAERSRSEKNALLISRRGMRITGGSLHVRLKKLQENAGIKKDIGLHGLRHSIATHLLQSGMELGHISHFLGHSSMESTQIYTHIINELEG